MGDKTAVLEKFAAIVNGREFKFTDPVPQGRQILSQASFNPADEHVLIQLVRHGTRSIGLDETVDLREPGKEAFRAFKSDRIFRFTIDGRGYEWGSPTITEPELRDLAGLDEDEVLILQRDGQDLELGPDDQITLAERGTEHLRTAKGLIVVYLDDEEKKIPRGTYTTERLIQVLGVQAGYLLNVVSPDGQLVLLEPGQKLRVKKGMRFISQVPGGGAS